MTGSKFDEAGSAEFLCLHERPQFLRTTHRVQRERAYIYGTEYFTVDSPPAFSGRAHHNVPCSVCYTPIRTAKITIPGRTLCPPSWTREYHGYFMTDWYAHSGSEVPVCVDVDSESVPGSSARHDNSLLFFIENRCAGILCPPYFDVAELSCVVCTKWTPQTNLVSPLSYITICKCHFCFTVNYAWSYTSHINKYSVDKSPWWYIWPSGYKELDNRSADIKLITYEASSCLH